jgi:TonB family protein
MRKLLSSLMMVTAAGLAPAAAQTGAQSDAAAPKPTVQKAVVKKKPAPECTAEAKSNGAAGVVVLRVVLSKSGEVTTIEVKQEQPYGLTESAIAAARKLKFEPAKKDGRPVSQ